MKNNLKDLMTLSALAALACASAPVPAGASGYEFDGVGARAVARGGAVIADAPDWTAIYWNPANLADVKGREAGLELKAGKSYMRDGNSFNVSGTGGLFREKKMDSSFFFGSVGSAVPLDDNSALGVGVYMPLLQGSNFKDSNPVSPVFSSIDYEGSAAIAEANVSYARRLTDKLTGAAGLGLVYGQLKSDLTMDYTLILPGPIVVGPDHLTRKLDGDGYGAEAVLGAKYAVSGSLSLGAVFRSGSKVKIEGSADGTSTNLGAQNTDFKFTLKQPPTSGIGAAWKYRKDLTLTLDLAQTWWRGFSNKTTYKVQGNIFTDQGNTFDWKNSFKYRAGVLWNYSDSTDFMAGYAYDTPAIDAGSLDLSTAIDVPMHRLSAAASRRWGGLEGTLGGLFGYNSRNAGGVNYRLGGWYLIGELKYKF
ncbi:MAG: outer membrane protein transport protein [Elusimicrobia bacterium]|nr:outer membrane protein transport protein [Elusimicrobiota bacterium]